MCKWNISTKAPTLFHKTFKASRKRTFALGNFHTRPIGQRLKPVRWNNEHSDWLAVICPAPIARLLLAGAEAVVIRNLWRWSSSSQLLQIASLLASWSETPAEWRDAEKGTWALPFPPPPPKKGEIYVKITTLILLQIMSSCVHPAPCSVPKGILGKKGRKWIDSESSHSRWGVG